VVGSGDAKWYGSLADHERVMYTTGMKPFQYLVISLVCCLTYSYVPGSTGELQTDLPDTGQPSVRVFTDDDGLPTNGIMSLAVDQKKYVWAGTQDGAAYYNGRNWTPLRMPKQGATNFIHDVLAARDGTLWFATDGSGLFSWQDGEWLKNYDTNSGLPTNATRVLLETVSTNGKSTLWVGTREGLARLEDDQWQVFNKASGLPDDRVRSLLETVSPNGSRVLWVGTYGGLGRFENGAWQRITTQDGLPGSTVFSLLETDGERGNKVLWAGTEAGLGRFENGKWTTINKSSGLPVDGVRSLFETTSADGTRTLWVGTDSGGLARYEHGRWKTFNTDTWLGNNLVWDLLQTDTNDDTLWIATLGGGIFRLERSNWITFDSRNGLPNNIVFSLLETRSSGPEKSFWIGTYGGGLIRFQSNGKPTTFNTKNGLPYDFVHCLLETVSETGEQVVWVGTERGLGRLERGRWSSPKEIPAAEVWDLLETSTDDGRRVLFVATTLGLGRFENDQWTMIDDSVGLPDKRLRTLLETKNKEGKKTLWVGTYNRGLAKLEAGKWTTIDTSSGLPNNRVLDLFETTDPRGVRTLWAGTGGGGVALLELDNPNATWQTISSASYPSMLNDYVYQIKEDSRKQIYLTTNKGVVRLTPSSPSSESHLPYSVYTFTTEDGLPSNECNAGASLVDSKGRIWVGTVKGAAIFDPNRELPIQQPKPLYLEKTLINDQIKPLPADTSLAYNQNNLKFEFSLLSHFREAATRYRTQMVGLEAEPTDWATSPNREFNYLPDGNYAFKVWAKDYSGIISGPLELSFQVRPAPWKSWWAYSLYALLVATLGAGIAYAIYRARLQRMLAMERVRTRIATDLHDDIGATLSQIAVLSEVAVQRIGDEDAETVQPLSRIAETSRDLVLSMSDVVWSINPQRDHLRDLVQRMRRFASDVFTSRNIDFEFHALAEDMKLDVDVRRQVFLIFKEGINNIARHSQCTRVVIDFHMFGESLVLRLKDNGKGFDTNKLVDGHGLASMRARALSLNGVLQIRSDNGTGTMLELIIPTRRTLLEKLKFPPA
jgi:ligand-binding sensor domain-containing protein/two-component sensor histidine kinase